MKTKTLKLLLHCTASGIAGLTGGAIFSAYGWGWCVVALVGQIYIMCSQYTEGRMSE